LFETFFDPTLRRGWKWGWKEKYSNLLSDMTGIIISYYTHRRNLPQPVACQSTFDKEMENRKICWCWRMAVGKLFLLTLLLYKTKYFIFACQQLPNTCNDYEREKERDTNCASESMICPYQQNCVIKYFLSHKPRPLWQKSMHFATHFINK